MSSEKVRLATVWLSGCSGCHMSFLDLDERLVELAKVATLVHSPIADVKEFPENVDITLIEGAVANVDQREMLKKSTRPHQVAGFIGRLRRNRQRNRAT